LMASPSTSLRITATGYTQLSHVCIHIGLANITHHRCNEGGGHAAPSGACGPGAATASACATWGRCSGFGCRECCGSHALHVRDLDEVPDRQLGSLLDEAAVPTVLLNEHRTTLNDWQSTNSKPKYAACVYCFFSGLLLNRTTQLLQSDLRRFFLLADCLHCSAVCCSRGSSLAFRGHAGEGGTTY
jgi:hypothetical protein